MVRCRRGAQVVVRVASWAAQRSSAGCLSRSVTVPALSSRSPVRPQQPQKISFVDRDAEAGDFATVSCAAAALAVCFCWFGQEKGTVSVGQLAPVQNAQVASRSSLHRSSVVGGSRGVAFGAARLPAPTHKVDKVNPNEKKNTGHAHRHPCPHSHTHTFQNPVKNRTKTQTASPTKTATQTTTKTNKPTTTQAPTQTALKTRAPKACKSGQVAQNQHNNKSTKHNLFNRCPVRRQNTHHRHHWHTAP